MLVWLVCGAIVLIVIGFSYQQTMQYKRALDALEAQHANAMVEVQEASEKRIKRVERASGLDVQRAQYGLMRDLMPALDALDEAAQQSGDDGLNLVQRAFDDVLTRHQMVRIAPVVGESFDPSRHEAIEAVHEADQPANTVARAFRHGWGCREEVIRPALVAVHVGPTTQAEPARDLQTESSESGEDGVDVEAQT